MIGKLTKEQEELIPVYLSKWLDGNSRSSCDLNGCYNDSDNVCDHEFLTCSERIKKKREDGTNE